MFVKVVAFLLLCVAPGNGGGKNGSFDGGAVLIVDGAVQSGVDSKNLFKSYLNTQLACSAIPPGLS